MGKMKTSISLFLVFLTQCGLGVESARILAMLPFFARSHHRVFQPLLKTLARAGHEVVVYSPHPLEHPVPNYIDVHLDNIMPETNERQEYSLLVGHKFKVPVILLQAFMTNSLVNNIMGNSLSLTHIPEVCSPFSESMTFIERLLNSVYVLRNLYYVYYYHYIPLLQDLLIPHFPDMPPVNDLLSNVSLVFANDHMTVDYAQPRTPNIIPVGGIHIEDEKPLPKDLQKFMDDSPHGVILFSLGTYIPDELRPKEYFDMYINAFKQLPQRILWKTRKDNIEGLPDNVMTSKWVPQRDILAHPKAVLFISHGGLLSTHEAVYCGVPVVAIPQFFDQHRNAKFLEERGIGVRLRRQDLSTETVLKSIRTILDNPKYQSNIQRLSRIFRDQPMSPAQRVVYWTEYRSNIQRLSRIFLDQPMSPAQRVVYGTEYVLRHGASHLKPASTHLSWYQRTLLDVLEFLLLLLTVGIFNVYFTLRRLTPICLRYLNPSSRGKIKSN